jgi:hypothetical protein
MKDVLIQSEDLELGRSYSIHLTREQAQAVLDAGVDEVISLNRDGASIQIDQDTVLVRDISGGPRVLKRLDVMNQIEDQLE